MKKEDIEKVLMRNDSTVLSFPDRGPWGNNKYRGNCSGYVQAFLMWKYGIKKFGEVFAGSGTGSDVAKDMGVDYIGLDLNPNPTRSNILVGDAFMDEVPQEFYGRDMLFMHPPYGAEIKIPYAGSMYPDPTGELAKRDLGQMQWKKFMNALNHVVMKYYASMDSGAYMAILMGDVRRAGFHSMYQDIVKPGRMEQLIIKVQNNASSMMDFNRYQKRNFVPIEHEYIMVVRKLMDMYNINFQLPTEHNMDIRDSETATWADVVYAAMKKLSEHNREVPLELLYNEIEGHKKCQNNSHWKEKIRQTLQKYVMFVSTMKGTWQLAS